MRSIYPAATVFLMLLFGSCGGGRVGDLLDDAETCLENRPDSALSLLRSVSTAALSSKAVKARYSLLYAMALDKNYIDTTDVSVVQPAVDYYRKHGTPDERMKTYFYLGRIQMNSGDLNAAAISYSLSEKQTLHAEDDRTKGLLYMAWADVYNKARNTEKEETYVRKGIQAFSDANDIRHLNLTYGRLAIVVTNKQRWAEADSLFRIGIKKAAGDTTAMSVFLSNYAKMKVVQPVQDPVGAVALLNELIYDYGCSLSLDDIGVYGYASLLAGDEQICRDVEEYLLKLEEPDKSYISWWLTRIEKSRGNYSKALDYCYQSYSVNMDIADDLLSHSVTQALTDYYASEAESVKMNARMTLFQILLGATSIVLLMFTLFWIIKKRQNRKQMETERLLRIAEESNRILQQSFDKERNTMLRQVESYSREIDEVRSDEAELEEKLESLRKAYAATYKEKYAAIGELCNAYIASQDRTDKTEFVFRRVKKLISCISDDDKLHHKFENQINRDLNNIVKHLKEDLGNIDKKESRFICYCMVGFDPEMIGTILGLSLSNVYTKKSRLKEKIRRLDSPYKEDYLRML